MINNTVLGHHLMANLNMRHEEKRFENHCFTHAEKQVLLSS